MSSRHLSSSSQAAVSFGSGYLPGFLLPPLAVIVIGVALMLVSLGTTLTPVSAEIQSSDQANLLSPVFTPEVQYWAGRIRTWAVESGLDPNLVATVMQIESCGDPRALSRAGAIGLFQVMPYHFAAGEDPYSPDTNALRGLDYLKRSLQAAVGDPRLALAGYNGGISVIGLSESNWTAQTQHYAYWGNGIYKEASSGAGQSPHLQEWLSANGVSLCRQAHDRLGISP